MSGRRDFGEFRLSSLRERGTSGDGSGGWLRVVNAAGRRTAPYFFRLTDPPLRDHEPGEIYLRDKKTKGS